MHEERCPADEPYLRREGGHYCCSRTPVTKGEACAFARAIKNEMERYRLSKKHYDQLSAPYKRKYDETVGSNLATMDWYQKYYCKSKKGRPKSATKVF